MTRAARPTEAKIRRACKAVILAGLNIRKVVVSDSYFEVLISDGSNEAADESEVDRLDRQELERKLYGPK